MTGQFWLPYHLGRETWFPYDTSKTWFWLSPPQGKGAKAIAGGYAAKQLK